MELPKLNKWVIGGAVLGVLWGISNILLASCLHSPQPIEWLPIKGYCSIVNIPIVSMIIFLPSLYPLGWGIAYVLMITIIPTIVLGALLGALLGFLISLALRRKK